jgi:kinesin family protein 4/21/27
MGTNYSGEESAGGIIPNVMRTIFKRVQDLKDESNEFLIRVSFIEVKIMSSLVDIFLSD